MAQNQPSQNFSMEQARAFASSPAGRQLLELLQQKGGNNLSRAQNLAAAGDMVKAKEALSSLLSDPQIQAIMKQMGG